MKDCGRKIRKIGCIVLIVICVVVCVIAWVWGMKTLLSYRFEVQAAKPAEYHSQSLMMAKEKRLEDIEDLQEKDVVPWKKKKADLEGQSSDGEVLMRDGASVRVAYLGKESYGVDQMLKGFCLISAGGQNAVYCDSDIGIGDIEKIEKFFRQGNFEEKDILVCTLEDRQVYAAIRESEASGKKYVYCLQDAGSNNYLEILIDDYSGEKTLDELLSDFVPHV